MGRLENIIEKLENYKSDHEAKAQAWQGVTIQKKKSGEEFAQIGRALTGGAVYGFDNSETDHLHPKLFLHTRVNGRYVESYIYCYGYLDEAPEKENGHEIRRNGYSRATWIFTADEMREAIQNQVNFHLEQVASYTAQIKAAKKAFTAYQKAIEKAENELKINSGCAGDMFGNSLYFAVKENVK